jgi:hypothetical protein
VNIYLGLHLITGAAVGIEYVQGDEDYIPTIIIDLLILRVLISWDDDEEASTEP